MTDATSNAGQASQGGPEAASLGQGPGTTLASKIDFLFRTMHPAGRPPFSLQEAAEGIARLTGEKISHNTLWKLRTGKTDNPTKKTLEGLAAFFGVNPAYFFDDEASRSIGDQVELLGMLRDTGVRGAQLRSFFDLSPDAQHMISELIESTARLEDQHRRGQRPSAANEDTARGQ